MKKRILLGLLSVVMLGMAFQASLSALPVKKRSLADKFNRYYVDKKYLVYIDDASIELMDGKNVELYLRFKDELTAGFLKYRDNDDYTFMYVDGYDLLGAYHKSGSEIRVNIENSENDPLSADLRTTIDEQKANRNGRYVNYYTATVDDVKYKYVLNFSIKDANFPVKITEVDAAGKPTKRTNGPVKVIHVNSITKTKM